MLDIGWTELLVIGIVALIVVGPKDLPVMFRQLGRFTGQLRRMARDFSRAMDEAADEAGAKDLARDLRTMSNPRSAAAKQFKKTAGLDDLEKDFERGFEDDDVEDEGARDTSAAAARGPHTTELAETRAAEAKARREEAVRRANARAASFKGFETAETTPAPTAAPTPAPVPGEGAPAEPEPAAPAEPEPLRQDKA